MKSILSLFISILFFTSAAQAGPVTFGDTATIWPGLSKVAESPTSDINGVPDLTGGSFIYTGHTLTGITLNYYNNKYNDKNWDNTWNSLQPGDWFFDFGNDNHWDYIIHFDGSVWGLYEVKDKTGSGFIYGITANNTTQLKSLYSYYYNIDGLSSSTNNRDRHPETIKINSTTRNALTLIDTLSFDGWDTIDRKNANKNELTGGYKYGSSEWSGFALDLSQFSGDKFTYAFTMTCANDVLFGESAVPTPEPASMLLMGAGAMGLAIFRRKARRG